MRCFTLLFSAMLVGIAAQPMMASEHESASTVPATVEGMPLLFVEDFEQGAERWEQTDSEAWKIIDENGNHVYALHQQSEYDPPVRSPHNIAMIKNFYVSDFVLDAEMKVTKEWYNHIDLCLFFGYQAPDQFYYVHIAPAPNTDPHANSIFLVNGEPRTSIAEERNDGTEWQEDTYHHVRIVRKTDEGLIEVYFDDMSEPIMVTHDDTFAKGQVGIGSFDDTGNFDNIRLWGRVAQK